MLFSKHRVNMNDSCGEQIETQQSVWNCGSQFGNHLVAWYIFLKLLVIISHMWRVAIKENQCRGNSKHMKKQFKDLCENFSPKIMWWMYGHYCFLLCSVNKSSYIYIEFCCYLIKTPTMLRFPAIMIYWKQRQN